MNELTHGQVIETEMLPKAFDVVVSCGMGPLGLKHSPHAPEGINLIASNLYNFLNAEAAKLLVAHGITDKAFMSGYKSGQVEVAADDLLGSIEHITSEAKLLTQTYSRAHLKGIAPEDLARANAAVLEENTATTTFGNFIQTLNALDGQTESGYWQGTLGVISAEWHGPRITEMLKMFGVNGNFISADRVMNRFGYRNIVPHDSPAFRKLEEDTFAGQPNNYENLLNNPGYVTKYLAEIKSPKRLQEMATALKTYIQIHNSDGMPAVFNELPQMFDPHFDYESLKVKFALVPATKQKYGVNWTVSGYKRLAHIYGSETDAILPR